MTCQFVRAGAFAGYRINTLRPAHQQGAPTADAGVRDAVPAPEPVGVLEQKDAASIIEARDHGGVVAILAIRQNLVQQNHRIAALVMSQTRAVEAVAVTSPSEVRDKLAVDLVGPVLPRRLAGQLASHDVDLLGWRDDHFLGHMPHALVHHEQHRRSVLFRQVHAPNGQVEALLRRLGGLY